MNKNKSENIKILRVDFRKLGGLQRNIPLIIIVIMYKIIQRSRIKSNLLTIILFDSSFVKESNDTNFLDFINLTDKCDKITHRGIWRV